MRNPYLYDGETYVRTSLVAYNAYFADGSNFAKHEYLEKIVNDAFTRKELDN